MKWDGVVTEQPHAGTVNLDRWRVSDILEVMNREDRRVAYAVKKEIPRIARAVEVIIKAMAAGGRLLYVGAGTSGRLAAIDAAECPPTFGVPEGMVQAIVAGGRTALWKAVEGAEDNVREAVRALKRRKLGRKDVVLGISASGIAPFVVRALEYTRGQGAPTIALTCNPKSPLVSLADISIVTSVGPEVIAGSTRLKAGTAQKMVLNMISTTVMVKLGKVHGNLMVDLKAGSQKLRRRSRQILKALLGVDDREADELLRKSGYSVRMALRREGSPLRKSPSKKNRPTH